MFLRPVSARVCVQPRMFAASPAAVMPSTCRRSKFSILLCSMNAFYPERILFSRSVIFKQPLGNCGFNGMPANFFFSLCFSVDCCMMASFKALECSSHGFRMGADKG